MKWPFPKAAYYRILRTTCDISCPSTEVRRGSKALSPPHYAAKGERERERMNCDLGSLSQVVPFTFVKREPHFSSSPLWGAREM